jgi:hypothetical protein
MRSGLCGAYGERRPSSERLGKRDEICDPCEPLARLGRKLGLLCLFGVTCSAAGHASAAPAPTLFRLSIVGTAHQEWSVTAAPVVSGECRRTETSEGIRTATFRTRVPVTVRIAGGRLLPVVVRGILGKVTLAGANTTEETCGVAGTSKIADCAQTMRAFTRATIHAASPRPGVVTFKEVANVRLATADCPREPADVVRRPLGPPLNLVRLPRETLTRQKLASINLSATRSRRKVYGSPQQGRLVESVEWTLKLVRVHT